MNKILVSIIVPAFNVENYLAECLDSLQIQTLKDIEIIVIDDGSTDQTFQIAMDYAAKDFRFKVYQQEHLGVSDARNNGLSKATGLYVGFVDSDDSVSSGAYQHLYERAIKFNADIVLGTILYCYENGGINKCGGTGALFVSGEVQNGKSCFSYLIKNGYYLPMICPNLYRNELIKNNQLKFSGLLHEDEYWTPFAFFYASRVINFNEDFYYYRQRQGSIMHLDNNLDQRADALVYISNEFFNFVLQTMNEENQEFCFCILLKAFKLYTYALNFYETLVIDNNNPVFSCDLIFSLSNKFTSEQWEILLREYYFALEKRNLLMPDLVTGKMLILIYNTMWDQPLNLMVEEIPEDCIFTTNKYYLPLANAVVFHIPTLIDKMADDIEKVDGQLWVAWSQECEQNRPWVNDPALEGLFDLRMSYHQDSEIIAPYYNYQYLNLFRQPVKFSDKMNKACMFISSFVNKSKRVQYLEELMQYTEIDSFGKVLNNKQLENDKGNISKLEIFSKYKFVIAFENALAPDYVTEKFFDPLIVGSVPVYLGAPNIMDFAPGDTCFIDVTQFENPRALADFINAYYQEESLFEQFFYWKQKTLRREFSEKAEAQQIPPFARLCQQIKERLLIR